MILVAVIVGYVLGAMPVVLPKIIEFINTRKKTIEEVEDDEKQKEIFDEWLNGPKKEQNGVIQEDIFNEYVTGQVTRKGG